MDQSTKQTESIAQQIIFESKGAFSGFQGKVSTDNNVFLYI